MVGGEREVCCVGRVEGGGGALGGGDLAEPVVGAGGGERELGRHARRENVIHMCQDVPSQIRTHPQ